MPFFQDRLRPVLQRTVSSSGFTAVCALLALLGTLTAAYPVTAVVVPAVLLAPGRWKGVSLACALGSALAATALVVAFHHMGWNQVYAYFPQLQTDSQWQQVMQWGEDYGIWALFLIAISPLPQTPALILLASSHQDYAPIFLAMLGGKILKYGFFAWLARHFPERIGGKLRLSWQSWRAK